ncbi:hypothetical protein BDV40DRAFT_184735 [Aspergillus tamarii]|uniref:Uncharacterized protein n=1 Tax=Aspergillus tamarii TaxID=41984 RepID=A0A5N6US34_ASPTM|nr:hypothetical protein BDV40DRAFT_184735 [Aspergillus tamarii]
MWLRTSSVVVKRELWKTERKRKIWLVGIACRQIDGPMVGFSQFLVIISISMRWRALNVSTSEVQRFIGFS